MPTIAAVCLLAFVAQARPAADLVLRGGAIYTVNAARSWSTAVAIADRKIIDVGDDRRISKHIGRQTKVIELGDRLVLPGFHDSHVHPMSGGLRLVRCSLSAAKSAEEIRAAIRACAASASDRPWLIGGGWEFSMFVGSPPPDRSQLDVLVPDRPAIFFSGDGFTAWVNTRALELAGIDDKTGILRGDAVNLVRSKMPPPSPAEYREGLRRFSIAAHKLGITSVIDANTSEILLEHYRAADRAGELALRVSAAQKIDKQRGVEQVAEVIARRDRARGKRLRADAAKIFLDGDLPEHTGALLAPYADDAGRRGELLVDPAWLEAIVTRLDAAGMQLHLHASGDRAIRAGLDVIEKAIAANGPRERRHQLAHVDLPDPAELPRFRRLAVAANLQLLWAGDRALALELATVLGAERSRRLYPFASVLASGAVVVAGSDWPSRTMSPLEAIQMAITRRPLDGGEAIFQEEERVRLQDALAAYTIAGAWIAGEEATRGSIEIGKAADLIVLERNLFEVPAAELGRVRVMLTVLDGDVVYREN